MTDLHSTGASVDLFSDDGSGSSLPVTGEQIGRSPGPDGRGRELEPHEKRPYRERVPHPTASAGSAKGASEASRPFRAIGYIRVSTEEQTSGAGLAAQRTGIEAEAERRGWQLLEVIEDAGFSGRDLRRPGITKALGMLRSKQADALVVSKLDRLSRSVLDFAALTMRANKEKWALIALDVVDTSTPAGEAMASVMVTFAQLERRLIGQRTREALAARRAQGVQLGRPRSLPDAVVARVVAERNAGQTLQMIANGLMADGVATAHQGRQWRSSTVFGVLHSVELQGVTATTAESAIRKAVPDE